ncbi:hybrid sensor histidine kinase/response regulator transcription factor [Dysgonomonas sp. GY617]|uniref:hybrid sensor histidine kinase/response regulator transcription factor n=1 Tax=Dysgonomonas sp. GY617 TaxID=2780420 RepID=UPI0018844CAB|nr:hybrid sensor histidine kinase/response regulator transcription factor [Dysgonomonas sp. GY617]MBF0575472.1 response regulator [Dysgonomonas sp. GY617]
MNRIFIILIFLLYFPTKVVPSDYYFSIIDGEMNLSHNNVKSIIQDSYGFMWFGTRNKLNRYDGITLKVFDCNDQKTKKRNNNISSLFEDVDKKMWVGTDNGIFIFDPITEKFSSFEVKTAQGVGITQWIADIQQDLDNNIWIVVPNQGVFKYNRASNKLFLYTVVKELRPSISNPQCIAVEKSGRVWIGTNGSGLFLYNKENDSFIEYLGDKEGGESLLGKNIYTICHSGDYLIVGIHEGKLVKLDKRKNIVMDLPFPEVNYKIIRHVTILNDDEIWVGTQSGLYVLNEKTRTVEHAKEEALNSHALSDNIVEKIYKDKEGGIWIGTNFGGVNYLPNRNNKFEKYFPLSESNSLVSKRVREMREDSRGNIWIGTEDAGIALFNPQQRKFKNIDNLFYKKTLALLVQDAKVWVGYFKHNLDIIDIQNQNKVIHFSDKELGLNEESIYALCEDRYGKIWLGNAWGIFMAEKNEMKFRRMDIFGLNYTYDLLEDSEGYIWVATMGNGVYQYDQDRGILNHYEVGGENDLSSNSVSSITEDHLGQIWFSTDRGGICVFNKKDKQFRTYSVKDGLPDDIAYKILEDKYYNLWFGTNQGLVRFNPETKVVKVFTQNDGLLSNQFNYKSGLVSSSGKLYFGSLEGLIAFKPEEFKENQFVPPVYITRLSVFNKEIVPGTGDSPLVKSIVHTDKIVLDYNQSNISFDFVSLSYTAPHANVYAYKMEDIDKDWSYTTKNRSATYAKLPPGKYTFMVKGSNNDGVWNETGASIQIEILPPWWASNIAYFIYLLLFVLLSYIVLRFSMKKYKKRNNERQRLFEIEKEKELYEAKVDFFTDIAHEIRTPVTLINGPLESILEMDIQSTEIKHNLSIIEQNTKHLLTLINQLLDFRKVDSNKFLLTFREVDITLLCKDIISRFEQQALSLKRTIHLHSLSDEHTIVIADKEGLSKIFSNLFSNAIKYSDKAIDIRFSTDEKYFTLEVSNDGAIVPDDLKERIFEPFFQVKTARKETSGSGIGLSLARSLAELHSGYLFYSSQSGLNTFTLKIPLYHDIDFEMEETDSEVNLIPLEYDNGRQFHEIKNTKTILIVEDNMEMLNFVADKLRDKFIVERATNGVEAQKILSQKSIDIVITDVMMPQMDGFELCRFIKSEIEYSHIIVVLLTARNDLPSKIQGLELGADAYVEKPFSFHYLQTLLTSLLNNRKREIELFLRKPFLPIQQTGMSKADEHFLNKIIDIINENITDPNFNVERLADLIYMSRSSLHRKIKGTMDSTPTDFIRFVRLQKAAELIQEGKYRINEICYLVGINSPSYFIKLFQTQYGMTPKEFEKQNK